MLNRYLILYCTAIFYIVIKDKVAGVNFYSTFSFQFGLLWCRYGALRDVSVQLCAVIIEPADEILVLVARAQNLLQEGPEKTQIFGLSPHLH